MSNFDIRFDVSFQSDLRFLPGDNHQSSAIPLWNYECHYNYIISTIHSQKKRYKSCHRALPFQKGNFCTL